MLRVKMLAVRTRLLALMIMPPRSDYRLKFVKHHAAH